MRWKWVLPAAAIAALLGPGRAAAATPVGHTAYSSNWSGYMVQGGTFSDVRGTWVEPTATCDPTRPTWSSFWVGLGGGLPGAQGLEQIGTEVDCGAGVARHAVWYELIPSPPVAIPIAASPGDTMSAEVAVSGTSVTLSITDVTTSATFSTVVSPPSVDITTAEWIAEAPSTCNARLTRCTPLPLTDFGSVAFSAASATADEHQGAIADGLWTNTPIELLALDGTTATPATLGADGASFTVTSAPPATTASPAVPRARRRARGRRAR
jgi:hypothetical protein